MDSGTKQVGAPSVSTVFGDKLEEDWDLHGVARAPYVHIPLQLPVLFAHLDHVILSDVPRPAFFLAVGRKRVVLPAEVPGDLPRWAVYSE